MNHITIQSNRNRLFLSANNALQRKTDNLRFSTARIVIVLTVLISLAATVTPAAQARSSHTYESTITEVPATGPNGPVTMPGPLEEVNSMTVFSGDLYVAERLEVGGVAGSESRIDEFALSGSKPAAYGFVSQLPSQPEPDNHRDKGIDFGTGAGETEMYVGQESPSGVDAFSTGLCDNILECTGLQHFWNGAGVPSPFKTRIISIAVDHSTVPGDWASGDVFAAEEYENPVIDIFKPEAGGTEKYVGQVTGPSPGESFGHGGSGELESIAVSSLNGDLVVGAGLGGGNSAVYVFRPEEEGPQKGKYVLVQELLPPSGPLHEVRAVAVDDGNGEIYVATKTAVYEFGPEGVFRGEITGVPKESVTGIKGQSEEIPFKSNTPEPVSLAVDPVSHRVFVGVHGPLLGPKSESLGVVDVFSEDVVVPDVVTTAPTNLRLETESETGAESWSVRPTGTVSPDSAGEASCWFAWGTSPSLGQEAPCSAVVHNGSSPVSVHASLNGLAPDTTYYYSLQARNINGTNLGEESQTYHFTTPGPGIQSESVSAVSSQSAILEATVAPHDAPVEEHDLQTPAKSPTSYYFQYSTHETGDCGAEPSLCVNVSLSPVSIGSGSSAVQVSQYVPGLSADATYHYRVVAVNEALPESAPGVLSAFYGPDQAFTTQPSGKPSVLPDGRAWELVSPVDKHGGNVEQNNAFAAVGGGGLAFLTGTPGTSSTNGNDGKGNQVLARRVSPGVWSSVDISLSHSQPTGVFAGVQPEYRFFSEDLGLGVVESLGPFSIPEGSHENNGGEWGRVVEAFPVPTERTPYVRHDTTCEADWSTCYEPLLDKEDTLGGEAYGGSPTQIEGKANVVGATPDASHLMIKSYVRLTGTGGALYEWSADKPMSERLSLAGVLPDGAAASTPGLLDLSEDGSRLVFGMEERLSEAGNSYWRGGLYLRDVARGGAGETVRLDLNESGVPEARNTVFGGASADGSVLFFTDTAALTKGSGTGGEVRQHVVGDLYVCEVTPAGSGPLGCVLKDLTPVPAVGLPGGGESARVSRVLGVSRDGSCVYFVADGVQAQGGVSGAENVYVAHDEGGVWSTSWIASSPQELGFAAAVSSDGGWFAFSSASSLTGYDNRDAKSGLPDSEVYLYNAVAAKLACVSCDRTGARPVGSSVVPSASRVLFDSGRLFFGSGDALVPQDTNENVDVYEFEPAGVGDCSPSSSTFQASVGGCVGLMSSGVASGPSLFVEANGTGSDVFFTTAERLVPEDVDTAVDMYDAHECGSSCPSHAQGVEECGSAAACRATPAVQPSFFGAPASATFTGAGNIVSSTGSSSKVTVKSLTNAQKLTKALQQCRKKDRKRKQRASCERKAQTRYGARSSRSSAQRSKVAVRRGKRG